MNAFTKEYAGPLLMMLEALAGGVVPPEGGAGVGSGSIGSQLIQARKSRARSACFMVKKDSLVKN